MSSVFDVIRMSHLAIGLSHTYTRMPVTAGAKDSRNRTTYVYASEQPELTCRYEPEDVLVATGDSRVTVSQPRLILPYDSELVVNDKVKNVVDSEGTTLIPGTLIVDEIVPDSMFGPTLQKIAVLRAGDPR